MSSITLAALDKKIEGWAWVAASLARLAEERRAEAERLLGPDRGE